MKQNDISQGISDRRTFIKKSSIATVSSLSLIGLQTNAFATGEEDPKDIIWAKFKFSRSTTRSGVGGPGPAGKLKAEQDLKTALYDLTVAFAGDKTSDSGKQSIKGKTYSPSVKRANGTNPSTVYLSGTDWVWSISVQKNEEITITYYK